MFSKTSLSRFLKDVDEMAKNYRPMPRVLRGGPQARLEQLPSPHDCSSGKGLRSITGCSFRPFWPATSSPGSSCGGALFPVPIIAPSISGAFASGVAWFFLFLLNMMNPSARRPASNTTPPIAMPAIAPGCRPLLLLVDTSASTSSIEGVGDRAPVVFDVPGVSVDVSVLLGPLSLAVTVPRPAVA